MADAYMITGKRGTGKSLSAARLMSEYVARGCPVATNMDIYLDAMGGPRSKVHCYRLPDCPTAADLEALPMGNDNPVDERRNGLLCLDEVSVFMNSRSWSDRDRQSLNSWLAQSRKLGWDLCLLGQHPNQLDKQVRESLVELHGQVRRMDKIAIPLLSPVWKWLTGKPLRFPGLMRIVFRMGFRPSDPVSDTWFFFGGEYRPMYDTLQKLNPDNPKGLHCLLSGWHLKGRYMSFFQLHKVAIAGAFAVGTCVGALGLALVPDNPPPETPAIAHAPAVAEKLVSGVTVTAIVDGRLGPLAALSSGKVARIERTRVGPQGTAYLIDGLWFGASKK